MIWLFFPFSVFYNVLIHKKVLNLWDSIFYEHIQSFKSIMQAFDLQKNLFGQIAF